MAEAIGNEPVMIMEGGEGSNMVATIFVSQKSNLATPSIIITGSLPMA